MILIDNKPLETAAPTLSFPAGSTENAVLEKLKNSQTVYRYASVDELTFELELRREIVRAARDLNDSAFSFEIFRDSKCNPAYWTRRSDGGFVLKPGVKASDAIRDIFTNGSKYATECATAMLIVYYKALLSVLPEAVFNRTFRRIVLMNWHQISPELRETGFMRPASDYLPGDRRYFNNPDVDPKTPELQGENVIDLGGGLYYGHGMGIRRAGAIINALNANRRPGATRKAYLMDQAGRPNFKELAALYHAGRESVRQTA